MGVGNKGSWSKRTSNYMIPNATATYNPPQRYDNCKICKVLDEEGDTNNLYEEHTSDVAVGCPRFANMPTKIRTKYATKAKICPNCLDPKFIFHYKQKPSLSYFLRPRYWTKVFFSLVYFCHLKNQSKDVKMSLF